MIRTALLIVAAGAMAGCNYEQPEPSKMPESGEVVNVISNVVPASGDISVVHDHTRGVTCWVARYNGTAISCLPDKSFEVTP